MALPVGEPDPALLGGAVGPERRVGCVGNEPRGRPGRVRRDHAPRVGEARGHGAAARPVLRLDRVQRARVVHHVQLAVVALAEGGDEVVRGGELDGGEAALRVGHPDPAAGEVAEDVAPRQAGDRAAPVDEPAGHRGAEAASVLGDRIDEARPSGTRRTGRSSGLPRGSASRSCLPAPRRRSPPRCSGRRRRPRAARSGDRSSSATDCGIPRRRSPDSSRCPFRPGCRVDCPRRDCRSRRPGSRRAAPPSTSMRSIFPSRVVRDWPLSSGSPPEPPSPNPA